MGKHSFKKSEVRASEMSAREQGFLLGGNNRFLTFEKRKVVGLEVLQQQLPGGCRRVP